MRQSLPKIVGDSKNRVAILSLSRVDMSDSFRMALRVAKGKVRQNMLTLCAREYYTVGDFSISAVDGVVYARRINRRVA